jgi:hypothetical protein
MSCCAVSCCVLLSPGDQATISYLGAPQLLPLDGRQQALGNFGFVCRCGELMCVWPGGGGWGLGGLGGVGSRGGRR